jgi:outer membrane protein W
MAQRIYRILFLLFVTAGAVRLSAQAPKSEVGLWVVDTQWADSALRVHNVVRSGEFDERVGYGISFNHFWRERFSTELSVQRFSADATLYRFTIEGGLLEDRGELETIGVTAMAQWHFNRAGRFAPYLGAGVTYLGTEFEPNVGRFDRTRREVSPSVAAGVNVRLTDRLYLAGEVKTIPQLSYSEGSGFNNDHPIFAAAGVKVRF